MTNVAVIVLDTLRYDWFKKHFDWLQGKRFTNAYSTANWTIPAHASLYTGQYPSEVGVHAKSLSISDKFRTLPEQLREKGYTTRLFTANPQIQKWGGWDRGYHELYGPLSLDPKDEDVFDWYNYTYDTDSSGLHFYLKGLWECFNDPDSNFVQSILQGYQMRGRGDEQHADGGAQSIKNRLQETEFEDQEFLFINMMETHTPYFSPSEYRSTGEPVNVLTADAFNGSVSNPERICREYDAASEYLSDIYQRIFSELTSDFDYIFTLSDHGEMLGEHEMWNHAYGLFKELTHIPLVVSGDTVENEINETTASLLDVHKTIAELTDLQTKSRGQNLLAEQQERDVLMEYHGFVHWHREQFNRVGISEEQFDDHDQYTVGIACSNGHAWKTPNGDIMTDGEIQEVESRITSLQDDLVVSEDTSDDSRAISEKTRKQLEQLGYA